MCAIPPFFLCAFFYISFSFFYVLLLTNAFRGRSMKFGIKGKGREVSVFRGTLYIETICWYGTAINRKDKLRNVLVHCVSNYGNGQIVERVSFHRRLRPIYPVRQSGERRGWNAARRSENANGRKKREKKKEKEQFVFRAMAAFRAVHIYVLTSFNFTDYRITRKI